MQQNDSGRFEVKPNNSKKKKIALTVLFLVVLAGITTGILYYNYLKYNISTDDAYIHGTIHQVSSKVAGVVLKVYVSDNQHVKKGDILATLDSKDFDIKIENARASLEVAKNDVSSSYAAIASAGAKVTLAQSSYNQALTDFQRNEKLFRDGIVSAELFDRSKTSLQVAEATLKNAKEELKKAKAAVGANVKKGEEALIKQKEALLNEALTQKEYTTIVSPADGYVTKKSIEAGNYVNAGQPILAIVALNDIWVVANYKETQVAYIKAGHKVKIIVDTFPDKTFYGKVDSIMAGTGSTFSLIPAENATGNYVKVVQRIPVKIIFDRNSHTEILRPGMSVIPTILVRE